MARTDTDDLDLSDMLIMEREEGRAEGARDTKRSQAARTRAKTTEHKRRIAVQDRKQAREVANEQEKTRRATTVEAQRALREQATRQGRERQTRRSGGGESVAVPTIGSSGISGLNSHTATQIVLLSIVASAVAVGFRSVKATNGQPQVMQVGNNQVIRVPAGLHSLGGVLIAGTVCLVIVQFNSGLGVGLALLLVLDSGFGNVLGDLSKSFFGKSSIQPGSAAALGPSGYTTTPSAPNKLQIGTGPGQYHLVPVPGLPGQYSEEPNPPLTGNA